MPRRFLLARASIALVLGAVACNGRLEPATTDNGACPTTTPGGASAIDARGTGTDVGPYDASWDGGSLEGGVACRPPPEPGGACGSGSCVAAARTHVPHLAPFIAKLKDGRVMVMGGDGYSRVAEIYTPSCDRWDLVALGPLGFHRRDGAYGTGGTMSLDDGRLLAVSGRDDGGGLAYSIYAPSTDTWTDAQSLEGFYSAGLTAPLPGKRFLLVGTPKTPNGCAAAAIYDEASGTFTDVTKVAPELPDCMPLGLAALHDGRVILASYSIDTGGSTFATSPHAFVYSPTTDTWSELARPPGTASGYDALVTLASGDVLMTTFDPRGGTPSVDVLGYRLDATTLTWTPVAASAGSFGTMTALPCGGVLSVGDYDLKPIRGWNGAWNETTNTLTTFAMRRPRMQHGSVLLDDGRVLVVGGFVPQAHGILTSEVCR